jgi:hypothetical protein
MGPNFGTKLAMFEVYHPYIIPFSEKNRYHVLGYVSRSFKLFRFETICIPRRILAGSIPLCTHWSPIFHLIPQIMSYILVGYMGVGVSTYYHHISKNKHPLTI